MVDYWMCAARMLCKQMQGALRIYYWITKYDTNSENLYQKMLLNIEGIDAFHCLVPSQTLLRWEARGTTIQGLWLWIRSCMTSESIYRYSVTVSREWD